MVPLYVLSYILDKFAIFNQNVYQTNNLAYSGLAIWLWLSLIQRCMMPSLDSLSTKIGTGSSRTLFLMQTFLVFTSFAPEHNVCWNKLYFIFCGLLVFTLSKQKINFYIPCQKRNWRHDQMSTILWWRHMT